MVSKPIFLSRPEWGDGGRVVPQDAVAGVPVEGELVTGVGDAEVLALEGVGQCRHVGQDHRTLTCEGVSETVQLCRRDKKQHAIGNIT